MAVKHNPFALRVIFIAIVLTSMQSDKAPRRASPLRLALSLLLFITAADRPAVAQTGEKQLLSFEQMNVVTHAPEGWGIGSGRSGIADGLTIASDSLVKKEGRYSLMLAYNGEKPFAAVAHSVTRRAASGGYVRLTGYMKTEGVTGRAGLWVRIDGKARVLQFNNMDAHPVAGTTDWKQYTIDLPYLKAEAERIVVGALIVGRGKLWIDDFRLAFGDDDTAMTDIDAVAAYEPRIFPADSDTAHYSGSGIDAITLTPQKTADLERLGEVWAFLKYYHAGVQRGEHNMDAALFRVLPDLLAANTADAANAVIEKWVDGFGKPAPCNACSDISTVKGIMQKPDYGMLFDTEKLPKRLTEKLAYIRDNRIPPDSDHYYISMAPGIGNPQFQHEWPYNDKPFPDAGIRLLALYRYWGMIQYFFPYRHLIGEDWNAVLADEIPRFVNAADTASYQAACLALIARIHDTHANLWSGAGVLRRERMGRLALPFHVRFVGDQPVVTDFYKDSSDVALRLRRGDVIQSIDGVPVATLIKKYQPLTPASNYPTQLRTMAGTYGFLLRGNNEVSAIGLLRAGKSEEVSVRRLPVLEGLRREHRLLTVLTRCCPERSATFIRPCLPGKAWTALK